MEKSISGQCFPALCLLLIVSSPRLAITLQIQNQQLSPSILIGPMRESQHHLFQGVAGGNFVAIVVVVLPELPRHIILNGEPLVGRMAVD